MDDLFFHRLTVEGSINIDKENKEKQLRREVERAGERFIGFRWSVFYRCIAG